VNPLHRRLRIARVHTYKFEFDLFGTDNVAPNDQATQIRVYEMWNLIWAKLTPEARRKVRLGTCERRFDGARGKVRAWVAANIK
jgi:hypothetical protein